MLKKLEKLVYKGLYLVGVSIFLYKLFVTPLLGLEGSLNLLGLFVVDIFYELYKIRTNS